MMKFMRDKEGRLYSVDDGAVIGRIISFGDDVKKRKTRKTDQAKNKIERRRSEWK